MNTLDIDPAAVAEFLQRHVEGYSGPLTLERVEGGQSNPTYIVHTPSSRAYVLRRKPFGALLPSAHAIEREFRVMQALADTDVPVPRVYALCEESTVIGSPFYVMEFMQGRIFRDPTLPSMTSVERSAVYEEMNRVISSLHSIDPASVGLEDFAKAGAYFNRQIARWSKQYRAAETETIEAMDKLIAWLPANLPAREGRAIIHGDFRLENLVFHPTEPRAIAVLDWELSTLGDPIADLAYNVMSWHLPPGDLRGLAGIDLSSIGIPNATQYVRRYCESTGHGDIADWDFYLAYNLFRLAGIFQGIRARALQGNASSAHALRMGEHTRAIAELGWTHAERVMARRTH